MLSARHLSLLNQIKPPTFRSTSQGRAHSAQIHNTWFRKTVGTQSTSTNTEPRRARATSGKAQHYHSARHSRLAELVAARTGLGAAAAARCAALRTPRRCGRPRPAPVAPLAARAPPVESRPARALHLPVARLAPPRALRASHMPRPLEGRAAADPPKSTLPLHCVPAGIRRTHGLGTTLLPFCVLQLKGRIWRYFKKNVMYSGVISKKSRPVSIFDKVWNYHNIKVDIYR